MPKGIKLSDQQAHSLLELKMSGSRMSAPMLKGRYEHDSFSRKGMKRWRDGDLRRLVTSQLVFPLLIDGVKHYGLTPKGVNALQAFSEQLGN